jgi:23S rRNA (cytidine1920-2'-O)/16S rRNA (cytidine1409-2'-O)-methyltransferase
MSTPPDDNFASRAGQKLAHALTSFQIDPTGWTCADLGANAGGFTDCLIRAGAAKVYAVERGYGVLDFRLRRDPRVVVMERADALTVHLPEPVNLVTIDTGWTRQSLILPAARSLLAPGGQIISLIKPHYEADAADLADGVLPDQHMEKVVAPIRAALESMKLQLIAETESPLRGHGGNRELLWRLRPL